jgi:hypothetical protein
VTSAQPFPPSSHRFQAQIVCSRSLPLRYISEKVVRSLAVGAVPVMWSRVAGWDSVIPGPLAAVFVEDFGFDAMRLVRALEAEAQDEQLYMRVRILRIERAVKL